MEYFLWIIFHKFYLYFLLYYLYKQTFEKQNIFERKIFLRKLYDVPCFPSKMILYNLPNLKFSPLVLILNGSEGSIWDDSVITSR